MDISQISTFDTSKLHLFEPQNDRNLKPSEPWKQPGSLYNKGSSKSGTLSSSKLPTKSWLQEAKCLCDPGVSSSAPDEDEDMMSTGCTTTPTRSPPTSSGSADSRAVQHPGVSSTFRSSKSNVFSALEWKKHQSNRSLKGARKVIILASRKPS